MHVVLARIHQLAFRAPLDRPALLDHFAVRAVAGIETVRGGTYTRSVSLAHGPAVLAVDLGDPDPVVGDADGLQVALTLTDAADEAAALTLCQGLLDLDADPAAVTAALGEDLLLGIAARRAPGRRVPGAAAGAELVVRAILGQQISLAGAASAAARLVAAHGERLPPAFARDGATHRFPDAAALAALDPVSLAMPRARGRSLVDVAGAIARGELDLVRGAPSGPARAQLLALPGIGPWTADYVLMRVLGDHDVFLTGDLGVRRTLQRAGLPHDPRAAAALAERWRPLRSYALHYLWGLPS